jgi:insertion element IS1 protein InsB
MHFPSRNGSCLRYQVKSACVCAKIRYYSDAFDAYERLWYHWGVYEVSQGKTDTYSVEADNAELRHYLARLGRRSRCFSRCPEALKAALKLFMYCFNQRQLHKQRFPNYPAHVYQFI